MDLYWHVVVLIYHDIRLVLHNIIDLIMCLFELLAAYMIIMYQQNDFCPSVHVHVYLVYVHVSQSTIKIN